MKTLKFISAIALISLVALFAFSTAELSSEISKRKTELKIVKLERDSLELENSELVKDNTRLSYISVMLRNYSDNRKVLRDSILVRKMVEHSQFKQ